MTRTARGGGCQHGFTLTELAVVVVILALILGGVVLTMGAMTTAREVEQTQQQLNQAREALVGFFLRNGRFPCPAAPATTGVESPAGGGVCTNPYNGFLPALTLGIGPTNPQGYLQDAWNNPIRYAVSEYVHNPLPPVPTCPADPALRRVFTTTNALMDVGISCVDLNSPQLLRVCDVANCAGTLVFRTPAVMFSAGRNFASVGAPGVDEQENINVDAKFVAHEPRPTGAVGGEFDDLVTWISPNILYNRLIAAGAI